MSSPLYLGSCVDCVSLKLIVRNRCQLFQASKQPRYLRKTKTLPRVFHPTPRWNIKSCQRDVQSADINDTRVMSTSTDFCGRLFDYLASASSASQRVTQYGSPVRPNAAFTCSHNVVNITNICSVLCCATNVLFLTRTASKVHSIFTRELSVNCFPH